MAAEAVKVPRHQWIAAGAAGATVAIRAFPTDPGQQARRQLKPINRCSHAHGWRGLVSIGLRHPAEVIRLAIA
jgi:hypothetical protein